MLSNAERVWTIVGISVPLTLSAIILAAREIRKPAARTGLFWVRVTSRTFASLAFLGITVAAIVWPGDLFWPSFPAAYAAYLVSLNLRLWAPRGTTRFLADLALHGATGALFWTADTSGTAILRATSTALIVHHIFFEFAFRAYVERDLHR